MSNVPGVAPLGSAQTSARAQAHLLTQELANHRRSVGAMVNARPGMCMADGWNVSFDELNGDFDLDAPLLERLLAQGGPAGPSMRAMPEPPRAPAVLNPSSALKEYVFAPPSTAPVGSLQRLADETASAAYGSGNALANASASMAGALQGYGERDAAKRLAQGIADILTGRAVKVSLGPGVDLYNSAQGKQPTRVRLRVRGLPIKVVTATIPAFGGPVTQWRVNGPGTAANLGARSMTAQQMRNTAILAGQQRLPGALRFATSKMGGGLLTFAPSMVIDAWQSVEGDLFSPGSSFNTNKFLVAQARSQSGNALGFGAGLLVTGAALFIAGPAVAVSGTVVLVAFGFGLLTQVIWNSAGGADWAENQASSAMR
jgi:hypothetical protein